MSEPAPLYTQQVITQKVIFKISLTEKGKAMLPQLSARLAAQLERAAHQAVIDSFCSLDDDTFAQPITERDSPIAELGLWSTEVVSEQPQERLRVKGGGDGHSYLIPADKEAHFDEWLQSHQFTLGVAPAWAQQIDGSHRLTFVDPREE